MQSKLYYALTVFVVASMLLVACQPAAPAAPAADAPAAGSPEQISVVDRGDVRVCPQAGLEQVVAEGAGDDVVRVLTDATSPGRQLGRKIDQRHAGVQGRVEEERDGERIH